MKELNEAFDLALSESAEHLTESFRESATKHGWSEPVIAGVTIEHSQDALKLSVPQGLKSEFFDHEYGTEKTPPSAVSRKFTSDPKTKKIIEQNIHTHVWSLVETHLMEAL